MEKQAFYCMRFYVTFRCDSHCRYCSVWQDKRFQKVSELSLEEAESLIRQCYEAGIRYIDFTGGEPLLNENLTGMAAYAKNLGIKTEVTTNGISCRQNRLSELCASVDKFNISLDTLDAQAYRTIRGVDCLRQTLETIEIIRDIRSIRIMMVVSKDNVQEMKQVIAFAQQRKVEIYLNPEFSYFGTELNIKTETLAEKILPYIYEPYTVVMLHFLEFYADAYSCGRPPCSANLQTLTFAPDGALMLPCYHDLRETVPWTGDLSQMLNTGIFKAYSRKINRDVCKKCMVVPYFGISFNSCLNDCFLVQSYSEKLNHLKKDFLNRISWQEGRRGRLLIQLQEFLRTAHSLYVKKHDNTWLYWSEKTSYGYVTDIYKKPLTEAQYKQERMAQDCWQLTLVPHAGFDLIYTQAYGTLFDLNQSGLYPSGFYEILWDAAEFQLRWWKWYISRFMQVCMPCDICAEASWLRSYLQKIAECGRQLEDEKMIEAADELLHMLEM